MPQLNFAQNSPMTIDSEVLTVNNGSVTFCPFNLYDSISFKTLNIAVTVGGTSVSLTFSLGLYSLTGATLSIANSISGTSTIDVNDSPYVSMTATSATQNITPGTWWFGFLASTSNGSAISLVAGEAGIDAGNAFPGSFIGGAMTESTNALPSSI